MKSLVYLSLLVLGAECAPRPQTPASQLPFAQLTGENAKLLQAWPLINKKEAPAVHRERAKRAIFSYGPLHIKAKGDVSMLARRGD